MSKCWFQIFFFFHNWCMLEAKVLPSLGICVGLPLLLADAIKSRVLTHLYNIEQHYDITHFIQDHRLNLLKINHYIYSENPLLSKLINYFLHCPYIWYCTYKIILIICKINTVLPNHV